MQLEEGAGEQTEAGGEVFSLTPSHSLRVPGPRDSLSSVRSASRNSQEQQAGVEVGMG